MYWCIDTLVKDRLTLNYLKSICNKCEKVIILSNSFLCFYIGRMVLLKDKTLLNIYIDLKIISLDRLKIIILEKIMKCYKKFWYIDITTGLNFEIIKLFSDLARRSNFADIDLKIILMDYQNNCIGNSKWWAIFAIIADIIIFAILATILNFQQNYFFSELTEKSKI